MPDRDLDLLVYDSTVFESDRRQHNGVGLMMTYLKVPFDNATDYVGSSPGGLPFGTWPAERPDLVMLVDAYGVYVNDQADLDRQKAYHRQCMGCHIDTRKAGDASGPELCGACHLSAR